jgi:hypothetical protein
VAGRQAGEEGKVSQVVDSTIRCGRPEKNGQFKTWVGSAVADSILVQFVHADRQRIGNRLQGLQRTDTLARFDLAQIRLADSRFGSERILRQATLFAPYLYWLLGFQQGVYHCGGNAKAVVGVLQRGGEAFVEFDRNHGKFTFAITFDELNVSH